MRITLIPVIDGPKLTVARAGDTLTINGYSMGTGAIRDGSDMPVPLAIEHCVASPIRRTMSGELEISLVFGIKSDSPETVRFPEPIIDPPDGTLILPSVT